MISTLVETIGVAPNPFLATVGLRVDPAPVDSGVQFRLEVELGSMPSSFFTALQDAIGQTLAEGPFGWQVTDCLVTMTHSGYWARQSHAHGSFDASMSSTAGDFRNLTPLVLMDALVRAGTQVQEPLHHFRLEIPSGALGAVLPALGRLRAVPQSTTLHGSAYVLDGEMPAARIYELQQQVPTLTHGEMAYGAAVLAAKANGAADLIDPRGCAVGSIAQTFEDYPNVGALLPAMGYGRKQMDDLKATIEACNAELVLIGTPIDLRKLIDFDVPALRITYRLQEVGEPTLADVLEEHGLIGDKSLV